MTCISKPSVDVAEQRRLGLGSGRESGCGPVDQFDLEGRPQVLRQRVVEAVADAAGGGRDAGIDEALGEPNRCVLAPLDALLFVKQPLIGGAACAE